MTNLYDGYKVFTHDGRPPFRGGDPVWDGKTVPYEIHAPHLDTSLSECGAGINYCASIEQAWQIAGMWPTGRPSVVVRVEASKDAIERGNKRRCSQLTVIERCGEPELRAALLRFSSLFGEHAQTMADSQWEWMVAFERSRRNVRDVERGLRTALKIRELDWKLKRFDTTREAREAWVAREARGAWGAWEAWEAWEAREAREARGAWGALTVQYAALKGWTKQDPLLLTTGIRDAYVAGLEMVLPTGPKELGWVMVKP